MQKKVEESETQTRWCQTFQLHALSARSQLLQNSILQTGYMREIIV